MFNKIIRFFLIILWGLHTFNSLADEGMWIPSLLEYYNIDIMQGEGLKLSAEDIYSINQASIKDAVVIFGRGCTGVMVSPEGLLFTNHHCGYSAIQSLSSIENDYLKNGFWAASRKDELPAKDLSVTFLVRIEDVTQSVLSDIAADITEAQRKNIIDQNIKKLINETKKDTHYKVIIKPFFYGNEYYMFIYEEFNDVRLVGTPPSSIGNFGSDPDNWVWPRHTGDFCLFRVYADHENKPAPFSESNIPLKPGKFIPISTAGADSGDFTMIMGYPGTTTEYLISSGVEIIQQHTLPYNIKIREKRMEIMKRHMKASEIVNLQYAAKLKSVSNAWKKWQGVVRGLVKVDAVDFKKQQEKEFSEWVESDSERKLKYGQILPDMYKLYKELVKYSLPNDYYQECFMATEIFHLIMNISNTISEYTGSSYEDKLLAKEMLLVQTETFFKDYNQLLDKEIFAAMLEHYFKDINNDFHPDFFYSIPRKFRDDFKGFADNIFKKSRLASHNNIKYFLKTYPENEDQLINEMLNDPLYNIFSAFLFIYNEKIIPVYEFISDEIDHNYRLYLQALREKDSERVFYPDANFTMRLSHGKVEGYQPFDAVEYNYHTTFYGKIEKYKTGAEDYFIPEKLIQLFEAKDWGRWADRKTGQLHLCFIASNHTSGGNSGSPVMNSNGHLIGLNFDRNQEGTMSDIIYDISQCRNISVDIRYVLFIIDKFANAGYLIEEMVLAD